MQRLFRASPNRTGSRRIAAMRLQRVVIRLTGADAHCMIKRGDENFSVADLSGLGGIANGGNDVRDLICRYGWKFTAYSAPR